MVVRSLFVEVMVLFVFVERLEAFRLGLEARRRDDDAQEFLVHPGGSEAIDEYDRMEFVLVRMVFRIYDGSKQASPSQSYELVNPDSRGQTASDADS